MRFLPRTVAKKSFLILTKQVTTIVGVFLIIFSLGCSNSGGSGNPGKNSKLTADNFLKIQVGMNHLDVKLILGSPSRETGSLDLGIRTMEWVEGPKRITVSIDNNGNVMPVTPGGPPAKEQFGLN